MLLSIYCCQNEQLQRNYQPSGKTLPPQHRSSESLPGYLHHLLGKSQGMEGVLTAGAASVEMPLAGEITEFTSEGIKTKYPASPERRLVKYGAICDAGLLFPDAQAPLYPSHPLLRWFCATGKRSEPVIQYFYKTVQRKEQVLV